MSQSPYLQYQQQDSTQTLREAMTEYHSYLRAIGRKTLTDDKGGDAVWLYHDATHAIFGQDTTIEGEAGVGFFPILPTRRLAV